MYTKSIVAALLSTALLSSAAPLEARTPPSSCSIAYPHVALPVNYIISQDAGAVNKHDQYVSFDIPAGSWGCTLRADFPAGYPITSSGNPQVYVFDSNNSQVGTVTFTSPQSAVINSFVCQPELQYRLSIGSLEQAGYVAFTDVVGAGLTMTYNC